MFEWLMAKRYITAQKRHSIMLICSIAAALTMMTTLFTCFSTYNHIIRDVSFDSQPCHIEIVGMTSEQADMVREYVGDMGDVSVSENDGIKSVQIMFTEYIGMNIGDYVTDLSAELGQVREININSELAAADLIDLGGRAQMAVTFAVFFVAVLFFALMLRLVIDTAFEISSKELERQFGVLQSIGAAPMQIVKIITLEGLMLSAAGIPLGLIIGTGLGWGIYRAVLSSGIAELYLSAGKISELVRFHADPVYLIMAAVTGLAWVLLSAYGTGMRVIRMSPIQAISNRSNTVQKVRKHSVFSALFGWKGKMAARNNYRQPKRFIITVLSLTLSISLYAGITTILGVFEDSLRTMLPEYYDCDLELSYEGSYEDNDSYRDVINRMKECEAFGRVSPVVENYGYISDDKGDLLSSVILKFCDTDEYDELFGGQPPLSYDELTQSGGFCLLIPENEYDFAEYAQQIAVGDTLDLSVMRDDVISPDEYELLTETEKIRVRACYDKDENGMDSGEPKYYSSKQPYVRSVEITSSGITDKPYELLSRMFSITTNKYVFILGTYDTYDRISDEFFGAGKNNIFISCDLTDNSCYSLAAEFIESIPGLETEYDIYAIRRSLDTMIASERIALTAIAVLITLIAIVNMVNVLSTSILNRRSELASMQCIGMTDGQLYGMTVIECLQYSLTAAVFSFVICGFVISGTNQMMSYMEVTDMTGLEDIQLGFFTPAAQILIASAAAFVTELCASMIPLVSMQKKSLVDIIRRID